MNNKEFIADLAQRLGYKNPLTQKLLSTVLTSMCDGFLAGQSLQVHGFGTFEVKKKLERIVTSPSTGQRLLVPPKLVLSFKPSIVWKDRVRNVEREREDSSVDTENESINSEDTE
jgi:DNA-binding protein HU-beta/integration host factor subunit alpha